MKNTNIICLGFYDDFARFFLSISSELKKRNKNIRFNYFSLYTSGWLYFIFRFRPASFISLKVKFNLIIHYKHYKKILSENYLFYKDINLSEVIKYHKLLNPSDEVKLQLQALSYIDILTQVITNIEPKLLILSGDSRMASEILKALGKIKNIPILFFEQGPFKTTIFDIEGVNANCSFRYKEINYINKNNIDVKKKENISFLNRERKSNYFRTPFLRIFDYLAQPILNIISLYPEDIKTQDTFVFSNKRTYNNVIKTSGSESNYFLLILQVPFDANMVYHSPFFKSHFEIVENIYNNMPKNIKLIVREHPLHKNKYENELYDFMIKNKLSLDIGALDKSINNAKAIIVNNSTVGIEAIANNKIVVVLGDSYYDHDAVCLKLKNKNEISLILNKAIYHKVNKDNNILFMHEFIYGFLIDGHFRDSNLETPSKLISNKILNYINAE